MNPNEPENFSKSNISNSTSPLFLILFSVTVLLRIYVALSRSDYIWPDEHFQTLEPASKVVLGFGTLSWEWLTGYRPWIVPALYMPLLGLLKLIGISGGPTAILLCRAFTAIFSSTVFLFINRLLIQLGTGQIARFGALVAYSFSVSTTLWSCAPLADNWAMIILWAALPEIIDRCKSCKNLDWFWIGLLVGLPVLIKLQMAFWTVGIILILIILASSWPQILWAALGGLMDLLILGAIDTFTWGSPFHSLMEQITKGRAIGILNGRSPWWGYFSMVWENKPPAILLMLAGFTFPIIILAPYRTRLIESLRASTSTLALTVIPLLVFLGTMISIEHKELRFLLPLLPAFYICLGFLIDNLIKTASWNPKVLLLARSLPFRVLSSMGMISAGFCVVLASMSTALPFTSTNITKLERAIYSDHGLSPRGDSCILLINHNWTWTHGQLILGAPVKIIDKNFNKITQDNLRDCSYAILLERKEIIFKIRAGTTWKPMNVSSNGYVLYKNSVAKIVASQEQ
ncbi:MAG: hypothetical protein ABIQ95_08395 [Bdellovibrionia bacterium]